jgi:hypothetical protein
MLSKLKDKVKEIEHLRSGLFTESNDGGLECSNEPCELLKVVKDLSTSLRGIDIDAENMNLSRHLHCLAQSCDSFFRTFWTASDELSRPIQKWKDSIVVVSERVEKIAEACTRRVSKGYSSRSSVTGGRTEVTRIWEVRRRLWREYFESWMANREWLWRKKLRENGFDVDELEESESFPVPGELKEICVRVTWG